ncbi:MAG TPA: Lrp/AsnC family transcriptional regulator [Solirubrobacteraceae bacterium]|jgi:Lrp/AsnC family leucine-responsive transcriptional regulator|nr:Lrp/AsnC family transcriptional regulator [Solirubrobacteraceae bacterium]
MAANRRPNGRSAEGALLDDVNRRLLAELQADARLSLAELGRRVGLSSPAVAERLHRLEQADVITGYHARLNPRALGFALTAVIRIRPAPRQLHQVAELARARPEVVDCRRITGEDCYVMTAHIRSVEHLEELIDEFAAYGQTTTSIVQSSPVPPRGLDLSAVPPSGLDLSAVPAPRPRPLGRPAPRPGRLGRPHNAGGAGSIDPAPP